LPLIQRLRDDLSATHNALAQPLNLYLAAIEEINCLTRQLQKQNQAEG
jgi:hypothetical protein